MFAYERFRVSVRRTGKEIGNRKSISSWVKVFPRRDSGTDLGLKVFATLKLATTPSKKFSVGSADSENFVAVCLNV